MSSKSVNTYTRIAFNTNGYKNPSGPDGKSQRSSSFECREGFGWDEWLFNEDFLIDGYYYGFIRGFAPEKPRIYKEIYLLSYTNLMWRMIAKMDELEVLDIRLQEGIEREYLRRGLWEKMMRSLNQDQQATAERIRKMGFINIVNIRFMNIPACLQTELPGLTLPYYYRLYPVRGFLESALAF
jgi:hypothetical protein